MMLYTTLNEIKKKSPCASGWKNILNALGKTKPDNDHLSFKTIIESNGLNDAAWCLRAVTGYDKEIRLYAVWCARKVEHLDTSGLAKKINDVSERVANNEASIETLSSARDTAWHAARTATSIDAWYASNAAAWLASDNAASGAAWLTVSPVSWPDLMTVSIHAAMDAQKEEFIKRFCTED